MEGKLLGVENEPHYTQEERKMLKQYITVEIAKGSKFLIFDNDSLQQIPLKFKGVTVAIIRSGKLGSVSLSGTGSVDGWRITHQDGTTKQRGKINDNISAEWVR